MTGIHQQQFFVGGNAVEQSFEYIVRQSSLHPTELLRPHQETVSSCCVGYAARMLNALLALLVPMVTLANDSSSLAPQFVVQDRPTRASRVLWSKDERLLLVSNSVDVALFSEHGIMLRQLVAKEDLGKALALDWFSTQASEDLATVAYNTAGGFLVTVDSSNGKQLGRIKAYPRAWSISRDGSLLAVARKRQREAQRAHLV